MATSTDESDWKAESDCPSCGAVPLVPNSVVDRRTLAQWLVATCQAFGTKLSTAHQVAGKFVEQLEKDDAS